MDKLLGILFLTDCSIWRPESSTEMMREETRYEWLIYLSLSSCFPIKPNNLARSVARVYADISLRYLFWTQCLYRPVLEWQLLTGALPNSCSLFNREIVWSLIWTCCSQDASVPITPLERKKWSVRIARLSSPANIRQRYLWQTIPIVSISFKWVWLGGLDV